MNQLPSLHIPNTKSGHGLSNLETETHYKSINDYDPHIINEGRWMLKGLKVVNPEDMLRHHFSASAILAETDKKITLGVTEMIKTYSNIKRKRESFWYEPIVSIQQTRCPMFDTC